MMKKVIWISGLFLLVATTVMAQDSKSHIGIKGGANMTKMDGKKFKDSYKLNYYLGGYFELGISNGFSIQPEVLFTQNSYTVEDDFNSVYNDFPTLSDGEEIKLNYLSIPILANIKLSNSFWIQAGPQYSILIDDDKNMVQNGKAAFEDGNFSLVGGVWFQLSNFSINARYIIGLSDNSDITEHQTWKSQAIQLGIGYRLF